MYTRKEIKNVLKEWKSYISVLHEAKEEGGDKPYVVRIFDFDGTIVTYRNQQLLDLMRNAYLYNLVNPEFMQEVKNKVGGEEDSDGAYVPKNVVNLVNTANESYICSKVKSTGFDVKLRNAFDGNLKRIIEGVGPDDKMQGLFDFIKKNSAEKVDLVKIISGFVKNAKAKAGNDESQVFFHVKQDFLESPEVKKYLAISDSSGDPEKEKIGTSQLMANQMARIPQIVQSHGLNIPEENIIITRNIATQQDVEIPGAGGATKSEAVKGTSGKIQEVMGIAKRIIENNPDRKITFEVYDNVVSNVGEMIDGVQKATPGYRETSARELSSEADYIQHLKNLLKTSDKIEIKGFLATPSPKGISFEETQGRVSKSKKSDAAPESSAKRNFQEIKNIFFGLLNTLKSKGGRPTTNSVKALDEVIAETDFVGPLVKQLYTAAAFASKTAETGFEEEFSDRSKLGLLVREMQVFVNNFSAFKQSYAERLAAKESATPTKRKAKPAPDTSSDGTEQEPDAAQESDESYFMSLESDPAEKERFLANLEQKDADDPAVLAYNAWLSKKKSMRESLVRPQRRLLREFKLVLKPKR